MKLAALAVLAVLTAGCTRKSTLVGGGVFAVGGVALLGMAASMDSGCAADDPYCGVLVELPTRTAQAGMTGMGVIALVGGLVLLAAGASMQDGETAPAPPPTSATAAPAPSPDATEPTQSM